MYYLNLDNFIKLKSLSLNLNINQNFNFDIFKNLCNQLEYLSIDCFNSVNKETFIKLFEGHHFSKLQYFNLKSCCMKRVKKNFIDRFPMVKDFRMKRCEIEMIEQDAFLNLKHANYIDLSYNRLNFIGKNAFSNLKNLDLILSFNQLTNFDPEFIGLGNSVKFSIDNNKFMV